MMRINRNYRDVSINSQDFFVGAVNRAIRLGVAGICLDFSKLVSNPGCWELLHSTAGREYLFIILFIPREFKLVAGNEILRQADMLLTEAGKIPNLAKYSHAPTHLSNNSFPYIGAIKTAGSTTQDEDMIGKSIQFILYEESAKVSAHEMQQTAITTLNKITHSHTWRVQE